MTAAAGVHGGDQLKARRKIDGAAGAGERDVAGFERLTQGLQYGPRELGQFVQKQHAVMR